MCVRQEVQVKVGQSYTHRLKLINDQLHVNKRNVFISLSTKVYQSILSTGLKMYALLF
jgi:hypothetical protein